MSLISRMRNRLGRIFGWAELAGRDLNGYKYYEKRKANGKLKRWVDMKTDEYHSDSIPRKFI